MAQLSDDSAPRTREALFVLMKRAFDFFVHLRVSACACRGAIIAPQPAYDVFFVTLDALRCVAGCPHQP